jgi:hypothetical protein
VKFIYLEENLRFKYDSKTDRDKYNREKIQNNSNIINQYNINVTNVGIKMQIVPFYINSHNQKKYK